MKNPEIKSKMELQIIPKSDNQIRIKNHKKAATHFVIATKNIVEAHGHSSLANEAQKEDVEQHILKG